MSLAEETRRVERRIAKQVEQHHEIAFFLDSHMEVLSSLSYDVMEEKLPEHNGDWRSIPHVSYWTHSTGITFTVSGSDQKATMNVLRRAIGGKWNKIKSNYTFGVERDWPAGETSIALRIELSDRDQVCQKVVTGVEEIRHEAKEAYTEVVETVEYVCGNLLD